MESTLDRIDHEILAILQNDGRCSNRDLARRIGLAPSTCLERVRKLRSRGVIRGFHADVDPAALGLHIEAMFFVRLKRHSPELVRSFREFLLELPEASASFHISGRQDFLVHVAVRDTDHLRELTMGRLSARAEVDHVETSLIFRHDAPHRTAEKSSGGRHG